MTLTELLGDMVRRLEVDFLVRKDRPFSREEFRQRQAANLLGTDAFMASADVMIIARLEWSVPFDSERQIRDVASRRAVSGDGLGRAYIDRWFDPSDWRRPGGG